MGLTEYGIVDFLAYTVQYGDIIVAVLGTTVTLNGFVAFGTLAVKLLKEMRFNHIICIKYDDIVIILRYLVYGVLHGLGLTALLEDGLKQCDRQLLQCFVGLRLHVVRDDSHLKTVVRIVLSEELMYRINDDTVFLIGRIEYQISEKLFLSHRQYLTCKIDGQFRHSFLPKD